MNIALYMFIDDYVQERREPGGSVDRHSPRNIFSVLLHLQKCYCKRNMIITSMVMIFYESFYTYIHLFVIVLNGMS